MNAARGLIDVVKLHPPQNDGEPADIELIGDLVELLKTAGIGVNDNPKKRTAPGVGLDLFARSVNASPEAPPLAGVKGAAPLALAFSGAC